MARLLLLALSMTVVLGVALATLYGSVELQGAVDETRPADVAIVLGAAVERGGRPSPSLRTRTQHAIELYRSGRVETLFLTGGLGRNAPTEAEAMRRLALAAGVPESSVVLDETATSTQESMTAAAREARARGWG